MLATILIVVMILLQTGALSLTFMIDRRFITAAVRSKRKSAHATIHNWERPKRRGLGNREMLYAFSSTRSRPDRGWGSARLGQSLHTDGRIYKIDSQWCCSYRRSAVAVKCFRAH